MRGRQEMVGSWEQLTGVLMLTVSSEGYTWCCANTYWGSSGYLCSYFATFTCIRKFSKNKVSVYLKSAHSVTPRFLITSLAASHYHLFIRYVPMNNLLRFSTAFSHHQYYCNQSYLFNSRQPCRDSLACATYLAAHISKRCPDFIRAS